MKPKLEKTSRLIRLGSVSKETRGDKGFCCEGPSFFVKGGTGMVSIPLRFSPVQ